MAFYESLAIYKSARLVLPLVLFGSKLLTKMGKANGLIPAEADAPDAVLELFHALSERLLDDKIEGHFDRLPPVVLDRANHHLTRFTGLVVQTITESSLAHSELALQSEVLRQGLGELPQCWIDFVEAGHPEVRPLAHQDFVEQLTEVLQGHGSVEVIAEPVLTAFFALWLRDHVGSVLVEEGYAITLAKVIGPLIGDTLAAALPTDHPAAVEAFRKTLLRYHADERKYLEEIKTGQEMDRQRDIVFQQETSETLAEIQKALSALQQKYNPKNDPISQWPKQRLEKELARQMEMQVEDLRAILAKGKTSLDALASAQAHLASGETQEAAEKFDVVIHEEQAAIQRLRQAYAGKAQIAFDAVCYHEALDYRQKAATLVDKTTDPLGWCDVQGDITFIQLHLAMYKETEPLMRDILRLREMHQGPHHRYVATALNNLALVLQFTNRHAEAEPLMRRALSIDTAYFGQDHPNVARDLNNLAGLLGPANRRTEEEQLKRQALKLMEDFYGPNDLEVAIPLNNLAVLLKTSNKLVEAESLMRRVLEIYETNSRPHHPNVATVLNNLAELYLATSRPAEGEPLVRRALKISEASYGPNHPDVARDLNSLARLFQAMKRMEEVEPMFRRALEIYETCFGSDHPKIATQLNNLAQLYQATDRGKEAEPLFRRSLAICEASFGPDHPRTATALNNLAALLHDMNRVTEAEPMFRRALKIDEASFGPHHPEVATGLGNLAMLLCSTNRLVEAEPMFQRALDIFVASKKATGHEHPTFLVTKQVYAVLLKKMGLSEDEISERIRQVVE